MRFPKLLPNLETRSSFTVSKKFIFEKENIFEIISSNSQKRRRNLFIRSKLNFRFLRVRFPKFLPVSIKTQPLSLLLPFFPYVYLLQMQSQRDINLSHKYQETRKCERRKKMLSRASRKREDERVASSSSRGI